MRPDAVFLTALVVAISYLANPVLAFWRLPCRGLLGVARMDPLVYPGKVGSHAHVVHGASSKYTKFILFSSVTRRHFMSAILSCTRPI
jgi:hypothetical protein